MAVFTGLRRAGETQRERRLEGTASEADAQVCWVILTLGLYMRSEASMLERVALTHKVHASTNLETFAIFLGLFIRIETKALFVT